MLDCTSLFVKCIQLLVSKYTKYIVLRNSVWFSKELCHYLPGHPDIAEIGVQEYWPNQTKIKMYISILQQI
jgi:hypothetical protein